MKCRDAYCNNCSALYLVKSFPQGGFSAQTISATVTYIKCNNRYFCITARHVVEILEEKNSKEGNNVYGLLTTKNDLFFLFLLINHHEDGVGIDSTFHKVQPEYDINYWKDLAIFEIPSPHASKYFELMGKVPIDFDKEYNRTCEWICAVGYPNTMKKLIIDGLEEMVASTCCSVQIEVSSRAMEREFSCRSEYNENNYDFSGMSGGPIFSIEEDISDFIGICFESDSVSDDKKSIFIRCQKITPTDILQFKINSTSMPIISGYHYSAKRAKIPWILFTLDQASTAYIKAIRELS